MADYDERDTERSSGRVDETDPLLVRAWMDGGPSATRWEAAADHPDRHTPAHRAVASPVVLPGTGPAPVPSRRGRRGLVVVVAAAAIVVPAAVGYAVLRPDHGPRRPGAALAVSLPPLSAAVPPSVHPAPPGVTPSAGPSTHRSPIGPATATRIAPPVRATKPDATAPGTPPPAVARTGAIIGDGGRCLDVNGGVPADGNQVQMFDCNRTDAQTWTLAVDGTLRVVGRCAQEIGNALVAISGCDSRAAQQWRAGPNGTLVNLNSDNCLTDPDHSAADFTRVTVTRCTGADSAQRWALP